MIHEFLFIKILSNAQRAEAWRQIELARLASLHLRFHDVFKQKVCLSKCVRHGNLFQKFQYDFLYI